MKIGFIVIGIIVAILGLFSFMGAQNLGKTDLGGVMLIILGVGNAIMAFRLKA